MFIRVFNLKSQMCFVFLNMQSVIPFLLCLATTPKPSANAKKGKRTPMALIIEVSSLKRGVVNEWAWYHCKLFLTRMFCTQFILFQSLCLNNVCNYDLLSLMYN